MALLELDDFARSRLALRAAAAEAPTEADAYGPRQALQRLRLAEARAKDTAQAQGAALRRALGGGASGGGSGSGSGTSTSASTSASGAGSSNSGASSSGSGSSSCSSGGSAGFLYSDRLEGPRRTSNLRVSSARAPTARPNSSAASPLPDLRKRPSKTAKGVEAASEISPEKAERPVRSALWPGALPQKSHVFILASAVIAVVLVAISVFAWGSGK